MEGLTLDTGALIALERRDRRIDHVCTTAKHRGLRITVQSPVVVEWWRGQRGPTARLLDAFCVELLTSHLAHIAGDALSATASGPSVVDAVDVGTLLRGARGTRWSTGSVCRLRSPPASSA